MVAFSIVLFGAVVCFVFVKSSVEKAKQQDKIHMIEMLKQRNDQVYYFRMRLINRFNMDIETVNSCMPSHSEMLRSDEPLESKNWVDVDKLVNLN